MSNFFPSLSKHLAMLLDLLMQGQGYGATLLALFLCFLYSLFILYLLGWTWRSLEISFSSFLSAIYLFLSPLLYLWGFLRGTEGSLSLESFSIFSFYRYFFLVNLSLIFLGYLFLQWRGYFQKAQDSWRFPLEPRKEFALFLFAQDSPFLSLCQRIIHDLYLPGRFYSGIYAILFIIFLRIIPLFQVTLLFLGVFLWKDIQYSLLFLPFSFLSWIYGLFHHSLVYYVDENLWGVQELIQVSPTPEDQGKEMMGGPNGMIFHLTDLALKEGYGPRNLPALARGFYIFCNHRNLERRLNQWPYFSFYLFLLRLLCWMGLVYQLNPIFPQNFELAPIFALFRGAAKWGSNLPVRGGAKPIHKDWLRRNVVPEKELLDIKRVKVDSTMEKELAKTSMATKDRHSLLAVEDPQSQEKEEGGFIQNLYLRILGQATHGSGPERAPSQIISQSLDMDGENRTQRILPAKEEIFVSKKDTQEYPLDPSFVQKPQVQENLQGIIRNQKGGKKKIYLRSHEEMIIKASSPREMREKIRHMKQYGLGKPKRAIQKENSHHRGREKFDSQRKGNPNPLEDD